MTERTISAALEDRAGKAVRLRLTDGTELSGELGDLEDGNVTLHGGDVDHVLAVDEIEDVIVDVRSADPE